MADGIFLSIVVHCFTFEFAALNELPVLKNWNILHKNVFIFLFGKFRTYVWHRGPAFCSGTGALRKDPCLLSRSSHHSFRCDAQPLAKCQLSLTILQSRASLI